MGVKRRDLFGLGALYFGALALEGCGGGFHAPSGASLDADDVERMLSNIDSVVDRLRALESDAAPLGMDASQAPVAEGRARAIRSLATLAFLGTYREVPEEIWHEPRIAKHLERTLPEIQATLAEARDRVSAITDDDVSELERRLAEEPELPMRIVERLDEYAGRIDVPFEHRMYLRMTTIQLASRFRYEGLPAVAGKLTASFDREADLRLAALGKDDAPFPGPDTSPLVATAHPAPRGNFLGAPGDVPPRPWAESCAKDKDCGESLVCFNGACAREEELPKSADLMRSAKKVATLGAWLLIPPMCAIGVLILFVDLFLVITAGILQAGGD